ncbi:MAG: NADH-quinone oxidoreductase subunit J [Anaerolineae bacterium]
MTLMQIAFLIVSAVTILAAWGVVVGRNILRNALALIVAFLGVAALYVLLEATFLAAVQVLIYVGAIAVLIIFAIMLTERFMKQERATNEQWWVVLVASALLAAILIFLVGAVEWQVTSAEIGGQPIADLGRALLTTYVLPFEVASLLLLMALVGAIIIAREQEEA